MDACLIIENLDVLMEFVQKQLFIMSFYFTYADCPLPPLHSRLCP